MSTQKSRNGEAEKSRKREPKEIIVDSNALFVPLQFKIDIFAELAALLNRSFELVLLSPVKRELEMLAEKGSPKMRKNACFALEIAEKCRFADVVWKEGEPVDDVIVKVANSWQAAVFTNDKLLRKRLRDISVPVIYVREKSRLAIDGKIS